MFQLPPLARVEKGWNPTIPALLLYPKRMKCDKKVLNMRRKPSYLSRNRQTDIQTQNQHHKCPILQKTQSE